MENMKKCAEEDIQWQEAVHGQSSCLSAVHEELKAGEDSNDQPYVSLEQEETEVEEDFHDESNTGCVSPEYSYEKAR
jgi:hypothetical protein